MAELPTVNIEIWKGDRHVAKAARMREATLIDDAFEGVQSMHCLFFPRIKLHPPVVFEHLAGTALMHFLHLSEVRLISGEDIVERFDNLHYVHGRSEVAKGTPSITSVLLTKLKYHHEVPGYGVPLVQWVV